MGLAGPLKGLNVTTTNERANVNEAACQQPVLSWPRIRSLYALYMLRVVCLTLCVAGLLLL
jgi:hypothetical protein